MKPIENGLGRHALLTARGRSKRDGGARGRGSILLAAPVLAERGEQRDERRALRRQDAPPLRRAARSSPLPPAACRRPPPLARGPAARPPVPRARLPVRRCRSAAGASVPGCVLSGDIGRFVGVPSGFSPRRERTERTERDGAKTIFVRTGLRSAERIGESRPGLVRERRLVVIVEGEHRLRCRGEAGRREARHRRCAAAEETDVAERVALERDRAAGVAAGLDGLAEGWRDIAQRLPAAGRRCDAAPSIQA